MTNEKLKEIKERLLTENDKRRRMEQERANACANYYERGVNDALTAVSFARPEQQAQPTSERRTNLDVMRTMSAEELAEWWRSMDITCCKCPAKKMCPATGFVCKCGNAFADWLNSPAKEDTE